MMIYADRLLLLFIVLTKEMSNHIHLINQPIMMIYLKKRKLYLYFKHILQAVLIVMMKRENSI